MAKSKAKVQADKEKKLQKKIDQQPDPSLNGHGSTEPLSEFQELDKTGRVDNPEDETEKEPGKVEAEHKIQVIDDGTQLEFTKIKVNNEIFATLEYLRTGKEDKTPNTISEICSWLMHEDFKKAFAAFRIHLILLCEYIDDKKVKGEVSEFETPLLDYFVVTSVSLSSNREGVTITGYRRLKSKKVFNMNSPFVKFYEADGGYPFGTDIEIAWDDLTKEAIAYLNGSKRGTPVQSELDFEGNEKKSKGKKKDSADESYVEEGL